MMTPECKRVRNLQVEEAQCQLSPGLKLLDGNPITPGSALKGIKELKRTPPRNIGTPSPNQGRRSKLIHDENFDPDAEEHTGELWYVNLKTPMEESSKKLSFEPVDFAKVVDGKIPSGNSLSRSPVRMSQEEFCPRTPGNTDFEVREVVIEPGSRIPRTPLHYSGRPSAACDLVIHYSKNKALRDSTSNSHKKEDPKSPIKKKLRKRSMSSNSIPVGEDDHVSETGEFKTKSKLSRTPLKRLSIQPNEKSFYELPDIVEDEQLQNINSHFTSPKCTPVNALNEQTSHKPLHLAESDDIFKPSRKLARSPIPPPKTDNLNSNNNYASPKMDDTVSKCVNVPKDLKHVTEQVPVKIDLDTVPFVIDNSKGTSETETSGKTIIDINQSSQISSDMPCLSPEGTVQSEINSNCEVSPEYLCSETNTVNVAQNAFHDQMDIEYCDKPTPHQSLTDSVMLLNNENLAGHDQPDLNYSESKSLSVNNLPDDEPMRPLLSPAIKIRKPVKNMIPKGKSLMRTPPSGKYPREEGEGSSVSPRLTTVEEDIPEPEDPDAIFLSQLRNNDPLPNKKKKPFLKTNKSKIVNNNKPKKPGVVNKVGAIDTKFTAEARPSNKTESVLPNKDRKLTYNVSKPTMTENVKKKDDTTSTISSNIPPVKTIIPNIGSDTLFKPVPNNSRKLTYVVQSKPNPEESMQESDNSLLCLDELCDKSLNLCDSLFIEALERKNSKPITVSSFDSIISPPSPPEDLIPVENILLGNTPSQTAPKHKTVLNETFEMEAKSMSDEEFVDASEDLEIDAQENRISLSPSNRTFEVSTPLSKSNSTFDLELQEKNNGSFDIEDGSSGKLSANNTFDVDMSPVHYNEDPVRTNGTFDRGKPLNTTFGMEVDDTIPKIVLNLTYDESQPSKLNKGAESPNKTLENTASTVVENITPNKTIETSSVSQTQEAAVSHIDPVKELPREDSESFTSCDKSKLSSSDGTELSSNSLNSSNHDEGCSSQLNEVNEPELDNDNESNTEMVEACQHPAQDLKKHSMKEVPKRRTYKKKAKKTDNTTDDESLQPSVESEDVEVEKPKEESKERGRRAKAKMETDHEQHSDKEACQEIIENNESGGGDMLTVPKKRTYKKRGKKEANSADETKQLIEPSEGKEEHLVPVKQRGRKPKIKDIEYSTEQEDLGPIQRTRRGRKQFVEDQTNVSDQDNPDLIPKTRKGKKPTVEDGDQSTEQDKESIQKSDIDDSNEETLKITTRRGRKPKAKLCREATEATNEKEEIALNEPQEKSQGDRQQKPEICSETAEEEMDTSSNDNVSEIKRQTRKKEPENLEKEETQVPESKNTDGSLIAKDSDSDPLYLQSENMTSVEPNKEGLPATVDNEKMVDDQTKLRKQSPEDQFKHDQKPTTDVSRRKLPRRNQKIVSYAESSNLDGVEKDKVETKNDTIQMTSKDVQSESIAQDSTMAVEASNVVTRRKPPPKSKLLSLRLSFGFVRDQQVIKAKEEHSTISENSQSQIDHKNKKNEEPYVKSNEIKANHEPALSDLADKISDISIHSPVKKVSKAKKMTRQASKAKIKSEDEQTVQEHSEKPATRTRRALPRSTKFAGSYDEEKEKKKERSGRLESSTNNNSSHDLKPTEGPVRINPDAVPKPERLPNDKVNENSQNTQDVQPQIIDTVPLSEGIKQKTQKGRKIPTYVSPEAVTSNKSPKADSSSVSPTNSSEMQLTKDLEQVFISGASNDPVTDVKAKNTDSAIHENLEDPRNDIDKTEEQNKIVSFAQDSNVSEKAKKSDVEVKKARRRSGIPMGFLSKPSPKPTAKESSQLEHSKDQNKGDQKDNFSKKESAKPASSKLDPMKKSFGIPSSQIPAGNKRLSFVCPQTTVPVSESSSSKPKLVRSQSHKNLGSTASLTSVKTFTKPSIKPTDIKTAPNLKKPSVVKSLSKSTKAADSSTIPEKAPDTKTKQTSARTGKIKPQAKPESTKIAPEPTRIRKNRATSKPEPTPSASSATVDDEIKKKSATRIKKIPSRKNLRNPSNTSIPSPTFCAKNSPDCQETIQAEQPNPRKRRKCDDKQNEPLPSKSIPTQEFDELNLGDKTELSSCQASSGHEEMEIDQPSTSEPVICETKMVSNPNHYRDVEDIIEEEEKITTATATSGKKTKRLSFIPSFKGITSAISSKINKKSTDVQDATNSIDDLELSSPVKVKTVRKPRQVKAGATNEAQEDAAPKKRGRKKKVLDEEKENEDSMDTTDSAIPQQKPSARSVLEEQIQCVKTELEMLNTSEDSNKKTVTKISKLESKLDKLKIKQESSKLKVGTRSLRSARLKEP